MGRLSDGGEERMRKGGKGGTERRSDGEKERMRKGREKVSEAAIKEQIWKDEKIEGGKWLE